MSQTTTRTDVDEALMREISAAFNSRDADRIAECFADDAVFYLSRGPEPTGRPRGIRPLAEIA
ncbi:MAG: nuclear transport factor 2 family protein [Alphaproteobacteria bacterium]|nr:nuclear transport factor 2 family protein [Alphaproteobacteria bacterium]MCW5743952.1 nuclear transport factor 2 family protein [Alphaproteobacteria bacterium]